MRVLVIESDDATREALHELLVLQWPDMEIFKARDGNQGLHLARTIRPELVLLEWNSYSAIGLSGISTAQSLRRLEETKLVPLIAITMPISKDQAIAPDLDETCNAWLLKPFSAEHLFSVVSQFAQMVF